MMRGGILLGKVKTLTVKTTGITLRRHSKALPVPASTTPGRSLWTPSLERVGLALLIARREVVVLA